MTNQYHVFSLMQDRRLELLFLLQACLLFLIEFLISNTHSSSSPLQALAPARRVRRPPRGRRPPAQRGQGLRGLYAEQAAQVQVRMKEEKEEIGVFRRCLALNLIRRDPIIRILK